MKGDVDHPEWSVQHAGCPTCNRLIVKLVGETPFSMLNGTRPTVYIVRPLGYTRAVPAAVPPHYASDFKEAVAVIPFSAKASAALSRRLLQRLLVNEGHAKKRDLFDQIEEVLPSVPSYLQDLHAIRNIGNFAAHPSKNTATGEIVDVEPGEATWLLDMLDLLFDFYFVQPAKRNANMESLNSKLKLANKPELPM